MHYLDNASTTRVLPRSAGLALHTMTEQFGNPSSKHRLGAEARDAVKLARAQVAKALGCPPDELYFTSGATEANNWAIFSAAGALRRTGNRIITCAAEHASVLSPMRELASRGFDVVFLPPRPDGGLDIAALESALDKSTILVSVMAVNNETGAVTDIPAVSDAVSASGAPALLHTDASQAFLRMDCSRLGADLASVSAHKVGGLKGSGALHVKKGRRLPPLMFGGGQEMSKRAGTEPVPAIVAFGDACEYEFARLSETRQRLSELCDYALERLESLNPSVLPIAGRGAPHILCVSVPGLPGEVLVRYLGDAGVFVSSGAACGRGKSHVLEAMGLRREITDSAVRISFCPESSRGDIDALCEALKRARLDLAALR